MIRPRQSALRSLEVAGAAGGSPHRRPLNQHRDTPMPDFATAAAALLQGQSADAASVQSLADDLLHGVDAIAKYLGETRRRTYYLLETGAIPAGKLGPGRWVASRRALREHFDRLTRAAQ
jgi:hypothetical protein